jgi:hypothetical protein
MNKIKALIVVIARLVPAFVACGLGAAAWLRFPTHVLVLAVGFILGVAASEAREILKNEQENSQRLQDREREINSAIEGLRRFSLVKEDPNP